MNLNKVIIYGNITADLDLKDLPNGTKVVNFSVATNRKWKDKQGQEQGEVEFHNVVTFGKTAENIAKYLEKGSGILIEGRLKTSTWDDKDSGQKRYKTEIIAENIQFGPKSQKSQNSESIKPDESMKETASVKEEKIPSIDLDGDIKAEDLPF